MYRSLILAGGGIKVGYQAGCLQVLLDEAKLTFDHVDAASGGCFNLAMLCSGLTGTQIADHWRRMNPFDMLDLNWREYGKLFWARSISEFEKLKSVVFPEWGLDWGKIQTNDRFEATFNVYNFSEKRLHTLAGSKIDPDMLCACVALPMWFPPVERGGQIWFDAVYCTDGNVGEAVRRGADEVWAIWTVSTLPEYRDGFLAQYFHIIETVADTRFFREWDEIDAVNKAIDQHGATAWEGGTALQLRDGFDPAADLLPPPGRKKIDLYLIQQEVPIHYVLNVSQDRMVETVDLGVEDARRFCHDHGLLDGPIVSVPSRPITAAPIGLEFSEVMKGFFDPEATDPIAGGRIGKRRGNTLNCGLTIVMDDLGRFIDEPEHVASMTGWVDSSLLGGRRDVMDGTFNLFLNKMESGEIVPGHKTMNYDFAFTAGDGASYRLVGEKRIFDDADGDVWADTTTLYTTVYKGDKVYGAGELHIHPLDFARQLTTFRAIGSHSPADTLHAVSRFGKFFLGSLWDVYARKVVDYGPI